MASHTQIQRNKEEACSLADTGGPTVNRVHWSKLKV